MLVIGPNKPRGPERRLTNTGMNITETHTSHLVPSKMFLGCSRSPDVNEMTRQQNIVLYLNV